jgi:hypothetical protein
MEYNRTDLPSNPKRVLTIDPGLHTGIALHNHERVLETAVFSAKKQDILENKISTLLATISVLTPRFGVRVKADLVIIEGVQVWQSAASHAAAARGNLSLLAYIVGAYYGLFAFELGIPTIIIEPTAWKGQLTEEALRERIRRETGAVYENEHILSAVGIGVLTKGKLW